MYYLQPSSQLISQTVWKTNGVRLNKLDKDRTFTSKWNPRRVSEAIYSSEFDFSSNPNTVLRSTHDPTNSPNASSRLTHNPTNSPNAASRSTHDLHQTATDTLGVDTWPHDEPGMLWYHLLRPTRENILFLAPSFWATTNLRNSSNGDEHAGEVHTISRTEKQVRKQVNIVFNEVRQFAYAFGARKREILVIQQSATTCFLLQEIFKGDF